MLPKHYAVHNNKLNHTILHNLISKSNENVTYFELSDMLLNIHTRYQSSMSNSTKVIAKVKKQVSMTRKCYNHNHRSTHDPTRKSVRMYLHI